MNKSWVPIDPSSDFSLDNLPLGVISTRNDPEPHCAVAIGDFVLDLHRMCRLGVFERSPVFQRIGHALVSPTLNAFAALGRAAHGEFRSWLRSVLSERTEHAEVLRDNESARVGCLFARADVRMHLPMSIGDYTDFYAGKHHAQNVGELFRGRKEALQPNYQHLPVGYHGRASSVVVSGTPVTRPWGQVLDKVDKRVRFRPCERLDLELEMGAFVCKPNPMGRPIPIAEADEYIFGYVLLNDWSARDIQAWEYVPLGPFTSKNFATTISPWIVLADALEPFHCAGIKNEIEPLPYLKDPRQHAALNVQLEVDLITPTSIKHRLVSTTAANLMFSFPQMLAHHTVTGCPMQTGDLLGSGTISGETTGSEGALLEQTRGGANPLQLADTTETRTFLHDGDTVIIRGSCQAPGLGRIGFGECGGTIKPATSDFVEAEQKLYVPES